jgi:hypothetical protein
MSFQEVGGAKSYVKYSECKAGDIVVEGYFVGSTPSKFGGNNHEFRTESGAIVSLNKSGQLDYCLKHIEKGDYVRVIFEGKVVLDKGTFKGKEANQFKVLKDPSRRLAPSAIPTPAVKEVAEVLSDSENPLA